MDKCPSFHYTPIEICKELLKDIDFKENEETLEPCIGRDKNFYNLIPYKKDWGEIELGRDIFNYDYKRKFNKCIVNPPYRSNDSNIKNRKNIAIDFIFKCLELCSDECWFLLNSKMLNSLTPLRLNKIKDMGFGLVFMRILNIKEWYGRYYWICFKKNRDSIIKF